MAEDRKKYNAMEPILQKINKDYISLSEADIKRNNEILKSIIESITEKMKETNSLFKEMYSRIFYGGSFYDGIKVGKPDEYDLDLLLSLPTALTTKIVVASNIPGFVLLKFSNVAPSLAKLDLKVKYKGLDTFINKNNYLDNSKVLQWIQKVVQLALNTFDKDNNQRYILKTPYGKFYATTSKSGPAYTLKATGSVGNKEVKLDIDLVPCFVFSSSEWPAQNFRKNPVGNKPNFFIVPKQLKGVSDSNHYWRLSFQEQERVLIDGKGALKPSIKLLKKMRDMLQHKAIASYYIKTVALWTIEEKGPSFWNNSLSYVFMTLLQNYYNFLQKGNIPYYWNKHFNLIEKLNADTKTNISNKISSIIRDIDKHLDDPLTLGKYLVSSEDLLKVKQ